MNVPMICELCGNPRRGRGKAPRGVLHEYCSCLGAVDKRREYVLKKNFGLSVEEYNDMLEAQGGVCAICSAGPGDRRLAVDHCHTTGRVRGLLCVNCNLGLGNFRDNPAVMRMAVRYVSQ